METLDSLYEDCRSYIALKPVEATSSDMLALYAFVEQYAISRLVPREVIETAEAVVNKFQKFHITV